MGEPGTLQYDTIQLRLYPNAEQKELFQKTFDCCRYIWNKMLEDQQEFYAATDLHFIPTPAKYKKEFPFLTEVDNQTLIQEHNYLSRAFRNFFHDPKSFGHPNFKSKKKDKDSFSACNHVFSSGPTIYLTRDGIRMTKAGIVKASFSRRPESGWKLRRITVEHTKTDKYLCHVLFVHTVHLPESPELTPGNTLGIKASMSHFYVTSNGVKADPPKWVKQSREKLKKLQRQLNRMEPGSKNYNETVLKYRKLNEHITNQRKDFIHKQTSQIANEWSGVCMRNDSYTDIGKALIHGNIQDYAFGTFREFLRYKLERQNKPLILIDRFCPTSKVCSQCGCLRNQELNPKRRTWICPECGATNHRDINGAINILNTGLSDHLVKE